MGMRWAGLRTQSAVFAGEKLGGVQTKLSCWSVVK